MARKNTNALKSRTRQRTRLPKVLLVTDGEYTGTLVRTVGYTGQGFVAVQLPDGSLSELHVGQLHS